MDRVARNRPNPTAPGICGSLEKSRRPEPVKVPPAVHARRGLRRFTIGVSEDDLHVIAKHGYGGALSTDDEQQAQAVSRFITDALAARLDR